MELTFLVQITTPEHGLGKGQSNIFASNVNPLDVGGVPADTDQEFDSHVK